MNAKQRAVVAELPRLRRYAVALHGDRSLADDLVQDTVERALTRLHLWRSGTNMRAWLFTIMHNLFVNSTRGRRRSAELRSIDELAVQLPTPAPQPGRLALGDMAQALDRLPEEQRQVVLLVGLEGLSYKEVAEVTGVPLGTVMSRLSRGREALRRLLGDGDAAPAIRSVK